jgi:hypothetical protein
MKKKDFFESDLWIDTLRPFLIWLGMVGGIAAAVLGAYFICM